MLATFDQIQKEMGADWEFANIAYFATIPNLLNELSVVDRLDGMIDRCIKRLLIAGGLNLWLHRRNLHGRKSAQLQRNQ